MTQTTDERLNPDDSATATGGTRGNTGDAATSAIATPADDPAVRDAAHAGARLIALWPLTDAKQLDNDAKYAENLQVRTTRMIARITTGLDVTMPDAEFVYEGADEIPGRPQEVVDALLAANDAYDTMADYSDTLAGGAVGADDITGVADAADDTASDGTDAVIAAGYDALCDAADAMDAGWTDSIASAVHDALAAAVPAVLAIAAGDTADDAAGDAADNAAGGTDGSETAETTETKESAALARRFAAALSVCDALLTAVERAADDADAVAAAGLPVLLFVNELRETLGVPRICLDENDYRGLLAARAAAPAAPAALAATARVIAPLAAAEWARHYEDVMWDPEEAKKRAKEEDERKNKEALAAKFAHVKDDPTKPVVEL